jgi:hypothetical protein
MMDILLQAEVLLRDAGYTTHPFGDGLALTFEDDSVLGFLHVFSDVISLLEAWTSVQRAALARCAPQLRMSREKAWNVYGLFLTQAPARPEEAPALGLIEEDFAASRKIARAGVAAAVDLRQALLPLLPIRATGEVTISDYEAKLRSRLSMLPSQVVDAILGPTEPDEISRILMDRG